MKASDRPAARLVNPSAKPPAQVDAENATEVQERIERQAELDARQARKMNKVAETLGTGVYIENWTHPCLLLEETQSSVSEYYTGPKIAIDKFYNFSEHEARLAEKKKAALKAIGVRYAFLTPQKSLADLEIELEEGAE